MQEVGVDKLNKTEKAPVTVPFLDLFIYSSNVLTFANLLYHLRQTRFWRT
jgi:hypothetical protein